MKSISHAKGEHSNCYSKTLDNNNKQDLKLTMPLNIVVFNQYFFFLKPTFLSVKKSISFFHFNLGGCYDKVLSVLTTIST